MRFELILFLNFQVVVSRLIFAIAQQSDVSVQLEALDILGDLLSRCVRNELGKSKVDCVPT